MSARPSIGSPSDPKRVQGWRRFDSLFARLLLLQILLALLLMLVFGALVYMERNKAVARLVGERWAPSLRQAAGWPEPGLSQARPLQYGRQAPPPAMRSLLMGPRMAALVEELERQGVPVQAARITRGAGAPMLWLEVAGPAGQRQWLGLNDRALLPNVSRRLLLALLITGLLCVGLSWVFTRRLMRPLQDLRLRMRGYRPGLALAAGASAASSAAASTPLLSSPPELQAIESAYQSLLQGLALHEQERALLLAGVSHDLRGPLARIRVAAGLLPDSADTASWRASIVRNTELADRLIGSFLDHVRAGELPLNQSTDLLALARQLLAALPTQPERGPAVQLDLDLPPSASTLLLPASHPLLLERLLANLLDNARVHGLPPVRLRLSCERDEVCIEVSDGGPGLPGPVSELLPAFARGDPARSHPGTGLGLAVVSRVVERMQGRLSFAHEAGRHRVTVRLPLNRG